MDNEYISETLEYFEDLGNCFLCNCGLQGNEEIWLMFDKRFSEDGVELIPLSEILYSIIHITFDEYSIHSKILCDTCCNVLLEYESCLSRLERIKMEILNSYKNTMHSLNSVESVSPDNAAELKYMELFNSIMHLDYEKDGNLFDIINDCHEVESLSNVDILNEHLPNNVENKNISLISSNDVDNILMNGGTIENVKEIAIDGTPKQDGSNIKNIVERDENDFKEYLNFSDGCKLEDVYEKIGDNYLCLACKSDISMDAENFVQHMRNVHNHTFLKCNFCINSFVRKRDLIEHVQTLHIEKTCDHCKQTFHNEEEFKNHVEVHKQFECDICYKKCDSKTLLQFHKNGHTGDKPFKCDKCNKKFASKYYLHAHLRTHTARDRLHHCSKCYKSFYCQQHLKQHQKLHDIMSPVSCTTCLKTFSTQHNLNLHMVVHSNYKPFVCKICGKSFARKPDIRDHERIHSGEKPFKCEMCPMAFAQRSNLSSHQKSTHFNEKQHSCDICKKSFKRRRLLDYHVQAVHTGERPHKCEICGASFVYPEHLKKHLIIHSGEKPFACEVCGKSFSRRENRNAHRFIHSEKKPYECMQCGAGFLRKPMLLAHMKETNHETDSIIINQPCFYGIKSEHL